MKTTLLAIGKLRGAYADLCDEYLKRLSGTVAVRELTAPTAEAENAALLNAIPEGAFIVVLDETGRDLSSRELAQKLSVWQESGAKALVFVIGGADGLTDALKERADFVLGLGRKTWPHKLARVMLLEQIYRARQINAGHPYHRD